MGSSDTELVSILHMYRAALNCPLNCYLTSFFRDFILFTTTTTAIYLFLFKLLFFYLDDAMKAYLELPFIPGQLLSHI